MRLTVANASAVSEILDELIEAAEEVRDAANSYVDISEEPPTPDTREEKAEYRATWEDNIDSLEGWAVALIEAFGYAAVPKAKARRAGV